MPSFLVSDASVTPVSFIFTFDHRNFYDPDALENGAAEEANRVLKRILIVEDNELHFRLLNDLLEVHGYKILKTEYGREAVKLARNNSPDLILMDIKLPDLSGLDVTRLLKQDDQTKRIPIIAVTAFAMPGERLRWLHLETGNDPQLPTHGPKLFFGPSNQHSSGIQSSHWKSGRTWARHDSILPSTHGPA